ncbi:MAG: DUF2997 domain-containing protein [Planctomycetes bacterium]|nr:DUF2997 domain-containing protein [Planctomycetota bacterium]
MAMEELEVVIGSDGVVSVTVKGIKGPECEKYVSIFQKMIQGETTVERTQEYYEQPVEAQETTTISGKW